MVDIKKDLLGGLPQQITEANDNLKGFLGTFQQFMSALQQVQGQMGSTIQRISSPGTPTLFGPQGQPVVGAAQHGGDPAAMLAMQTQSGQITSAINNLAHSSAQNNLALTRTLEALNSAINQLNGTIGGMSGPAPGPGGIPAPSGVPGGPSIPGAPAPGGGPQAPSLGGRLQAFSKVASALAAGTGLAFGGYEIYNQAALSQDKILQDAQLKRLQAQASLSEFAAKVNIESHDMTNSENILRYRGNMFLAPGERGQYFGSSTSIARSYDLAGESTKLQIENEKRQRDLQMMSSLGKGVGGILQGAAGGAVAGAVTGAVLGGGAGAIPGAIIGGIGGLLTSGLSSAGDITRAYLESPYTAMTGGLSGGVSGAFGRFRRGEQYDRLAKVAEEAARLGIPVNMNDLARQYQDAEMQARAPYAKSIVDQRLDMVKARQEGALLVGEYAVSEKDYFKFTNNERSAMAEQIRKADEKAATAAAEQKSKLRMSKVTAEIEADKSPFMFTKTQGIKKAMDLYDRLDETDLPPAAPPGFEKFQNYNIDRLMRAVRTVETGSEAGDYNSVNSIGMIGAYQISPRIWDDLAKKRMGMTVNEMRGNKAVQDKFYREVLAPQFKQQAVDLQKRNDLAKMLPMELVAGLEQLGPGNVENFFQTGNPDIYGNDAVAYLRGLSRSSGLKIPNEFFSKLNSLNVNGGASNFGGSPLAGAAPFIPQEMGVAASLEMSMGDFNRHRNQLTNFLGSVYSGQEGRPYQGLVAGEGQTARMIRLGRSGLGTFDQMLGNLGMINQVSGGQDNTGRLESVLTQAVAAGFDKSRTAQQFVQTTGTIADSLRVTNMANISAILGTTTNLSSAYGVADERGLKQAAAGLQSYAQFTGQQAGLSGTLTALGALRAGFKPNQGFNIVSTLNATQMSDFIDTLNSGGQITDRKLLDLMSVSGVSDRKKLADMLKSVREVTTAPFSTKLEQFYTGRTVGGIKFTTMPDFMRQLATTDRKTQNQALQEMSTRIGEIFANDIVHEQGGRAYLAEEARMFGISGSADLNKKIDRSNAVYRDAATQNRFNFIEQLTKQQVLGDRGATNPKIRDMYFDAIKNGVGLTRTVNVGGQEIPVNTETYNKGTLNGKALPGGFKTAADEMFNNMTGFELAREAQERGEAEAGTQHVHIDNYYDVGNAIAIALSIQKQAMRDMGVK